MKSLTYSLAVLFLAGGTLLGSPNAWYQYEGFGDIRGLVDRTQNDLRSSSELEHNNGDQRARYRNAQGHLSTFDRNLTKGKFNKGELNKAIHDVQEVLNKNSLQASARDALIRDVEDLRTARDHRY
ncbi:MAG: hypothetical protein M3Y72_20430 [Acidobacteriota bacterium]|nr:hypothetical protein [Acidobacteriota bacterium]